MAITHFTPQLISRGSGRSAVLSAAYRHCARMEHEAEGRIVDYSAKSGLRHEEFLLPAGAPEWARVLIADRSVAGAAEAFWNAVEAFEKRSDAQLAREFIIALPVELSVDQNIALVHEFVETQMLARGQVADWVFHDEPGNPHIHLMTTLRSLTEAGFGAKKIAVIGEDGQPLRNDAGKIVYRLWSGEKTEFLEQRGGWLDLQNKHLALAGLDIRVDGRSYAERGIDLVPTTHIGVAAKAIDRKEAAAGWSPRLERVTLHEERRTENRERIQRRPEIVLDLVTREMSVFTERDIAKVLHRYVDDAATFQRLMARILQSPDVLRLEGERIGFASGVREPAKYTTRELIRLEGEMAHRAIWLAARSSHGVRDTVLQTVFQRHARLSEEQRVAIAHVAGDGRLAAVVGRAGAGKTTMMKAAREVWEAAGYRVVGAALAGKAAEGLEKEAGIASRTLSSWELAWSKGRETIDDRTVFVLDEAGMVSSRQMALFVETVVKAGAKLVLVGDPDQLQPIEAGAAFRAIVERTGYAELETIYRQREQWMRDASLDLARGHVAAALKSYEANGKLQPRTLKSEAIAALIADWNCDYDPGKSMLILAHLRRDVRALNDMARAKLIERGLIEEGHAFRTGDGPRRFAAGDQIVFLKNDAALGVKNGMIAQVVEARLGGFKAMVGESEHRHHVDVDQRFYAHVDHGYATTIHKSQGATVDRVKLLATLSLDRHLSYVALTRHREDVGLYYGALSFRKAGGLTKILSQHRGKETTLDYERAGFYRAALRFAEARGLHLVRVARTLVADKLRLTIRQKDKLAHLGTRLLALGLRLGLGAAPKHTVPETQEEARPMVAGITAFLKSVDQAVEDRLAADPGLSRQWEEVSTRFRFVFAEPEAAFRKVDVDGMIRNADTAKSTLSTIAAKPESFGALKGKTGLLAGRADREDRERANLNVPALARDLERYLRLRAEAERKFEPEERVARVKVAVDIPALSSMARQTLEKVRDALDRNDLPAALAFSLEDKMIKAELEGFARAVSERFGERSMLANGAKTPDGPVFERLAAGMSAGQTDELKSAWSTMRTAQQLAAQQRTTEGLKQAEAMRQSQRQGLSLK
ncbi:Ti-type conjugative transfer relaxase TraA [Ancylobacter dichloromethanicus]|uniref:Conjugal transfer protein TraA n=1 Tax=Ancylobacter dichloromethanicus TaxID=518825 RepID=A0A9W6J5M5_9HYPH|nr:Ti-type conjugative transfer relaxase TraA [Ancylobacter dichloromethanicus]MBS7555952.1 Ti-type conjugative transfer relaxase TraA [Ancylobacter dichloromethanicus]GLK70173.1 putative conjugal transfer protein TraA [Ancylobacter dichloromethanicus]